MDSFTEQLVVRKNSAKVYAKAMLILLAVLSFPGIIMLIGLASSGGFRYLFIAGVVFLLFALYGAYYIITGLYTEYEYAVTNSNITIDKVIAKRSRKRIISVDLKKFNTLKKLSESETEGKRYRKIFRASITETGDDVYAAEMHLEKFNGDCLLLFSPDQKTFDAMKSYLRVNVKADLVKAGIYQPTAASSSKKQPPVKPAAKKMSLTKGAAPEQREKAKDEAKEKAPEKAEAETKPEEKKPEASEKKEMKQGGNNPARNSQKSGGKKKSGGSKRK